jgi:hypothetical protein
MLNLAINRIGNEGLEKLVKSKNYPKLIDLRLCINKISEEGAKSLL